MHVRKDRQFPLKNLSKSAVLAISLLTGASCGGSNTPGGMQSPASNLAVLDSLMRNTVRSMVQHMKPTGSETCGVRFVKSDNEFLEHLFLQALGQFCATMRVGDSTIGATSIFEIQPLRADVAYLNAHRTGLFGHTRVERSITLELSTKIVTAGSGEIIYAGVRRGEMRDTIDVASVDHVHSPAIRATMATVPRETFLDRVLEPIVILFATGVIVYLFFTVRS